MERGVSFHSVVPPAMAIIVPQARFIFEAGHEYGAEAPCKRGRPLAKSNNADTDLRWERERLFHRLHDFSQAFDCFPRQAQHLSRRPPSTPLARCPFMFDKVWRTDGLHLLRKDVACLRVPVPPGVLFLRACLHALLRCGAAVVGSPWRALK